MSQQYKRFKETFLQNHPSSIKQQSSSNNNNRLNSRQNDAYNNYLSNKQFHAQFTHNPSKDDLRIQNQSHFPFDQIQNQTFNELPEQNFMSFKNIQQFKNPTNNNKRQSSYTNNRMIQSEYQVNDQFNRYNTQQQYSRADYQRPTFINQLSSDRFEIDRINKQLHNVRANTTQNYYQARHNQQIPESNKQIHYYQSTILSQTNRPQLNRSPSANKQSARQSQNLLSPKKLPIIYGNPQAPQIIPAKHIAADQYVFQAPLQPYQIMQPVIQQMPMQSLSASQSNSRIMINPQIQRSPSFSIQSPNQTPHIQTSLSTNQISNNHMQMIIPAISAGQYRPVNQQTQPMVPRQDYNDVKNQCMMWQQKYQQLNQQFLRSRQNQTNIQEFQLIKQQNLKIKEKLRYYQQRDKQMFNKIKSSSENVLEKYQNSLMKECVLLMDRFRLQMKQKQRK